MWVLRTLLASLAILAAGVASLAVATDGFRAFTSDAARRIDVREHPRTLPQAQLQTANGRTISFADLEGRWVLVDFVYTRCNTYCSIQGTEFAQMQHRLAGPIASGRVTLLSISFDPKHDSPTQLAAYQRRSGDRGAGWIAARPESVSDLRALMSVFGVTAIPDGLGGYVHNSAVAVVNPHGRLVAITDWDAPREAERYVFHGAEQ